MSFSINICHCRLKGHFWQGSTSRSVTRLSQWLPPKSSCQIKNKTEMWTFAKMSSWRRDDLAAVLLRPSQIVMYYYRGGCLSSKNNPPSEVSEHQDTLNPDLSWSLFRQIVSSCLYFICLFLVVRNTKCI